MTFRSIRRFILCALALAAAPVHAHAQQFGRNKVQYRAFDFQVIRTEHFDVYYYDQERTAAMDAARMVERAYARISRLLQHQFRERKPIILYASHSDFQQTNATGETIDESTGGFTEPVKNRLVLPFTGSYADFDHVLNHELVHAFQFDILYHRGVMNDAAPFAVRTPLWFMEGMAEYLSLGRIDPHTESWLRDAVLSGYLRDIDEMSQRDDYLSYRFGQSLWAYIGSRWGDEVVGVLLQKTPRVGIERAFETTLGVSLDQLSREWEASVRARYLPQLTEYRRPGEDARRLTSHDELYDPWFLAPSLSPDGKWLTFVSQRDGFFFDLFLADAATGRVKKKLVSGAQESLESLRYMNSSSAFSPDGRRIAFTAKTGGEDALYVYDLDRGRIVRKLRFELNGVSNPTWSPDGTRIAFTGLDGGISDLFVTDLEGHAQRLTNDRYADLLPSWSPDGQTIAFSTDRGDVTDFGRLRYDNLKVAVYRVADGRIDILPHQESGKNLNPVWAPDGESLVWISDRTGINDLYLFDLKSRELSRVTSYLSGVVAVTPLSPALSWSRESGRLAFVYFEQAGYNVYSMSDPRALPRLPVQDASAAIVAIADSAAAHPADAAREDTAASRTRVVASDASAAAGTQDRPATESDSIAQRRGSAPFFPSVEAPDSTAAVSFYRSAEGFRPSDVIRPGEETDRPVSILALMDSTDIAVPDTSEFELRDYHVKFTPDMIGRPTVGAQVGGYYGNGVYGGSYITLSDMLGNHNIVLAGQVNGSFKDADFLAAYSFLKRRANYGFALQQIPIYRYLGGGNFPLDMDGQEQNVSADVFMRDVIRTAQGIFSYPFSTYRRLEVGVNATSFSRDILYQGYNLDGGLEPFRHTVEVDGMSFLEPSVAMVFDNALFGWTGPIYGHRYRLQLSRTFGSLGYSEALADMRAYANYRQHAVLAARLITLARFGSDADRFSLYWGGPYFLRGYDGNSYDLNGRECLDSRVYSGSNSLSACPARDQLIGSSAALMNLELRVPVIKELQIGFLGNFPPVDAVAFFDGGLAWDNEVCGDFTEQQYGTCSGASAHPVHLVWDRKPGEDPYLVREPLFSYGVGLRLNVFYTILRLDYAIPLNRAERGGRFEFGLGPSF